MKEFFGNEVILASDTAVELYNAVKDLPIMDYHCHLVPQQIAENITFENIGEMWLAADHYKWRTMRICGVDEYYITGGASFKEKFMAFAEIMPKLVGNAVYYWAHFELRQIFGVTLPLNTKNAEAIWNACNEKIATLDVNGILKQFNVEFIATTDDPIDSLEYHGTWGGAKVTPTFRPDKVFLLDDAYMAQLSTASGIAITDVASLVAAVENRLDYFVSKGCKISDHGMENIPTFCDAEEAQTIYENRANLTACDREKFTGFILCEIARMCKKRDVAMQWHFSVIRNVNTPMFEKVGVDAGFDVFTDTIKAKNLTNIFNHLAKQDNLPKVILYTLNPYVDKMICAISGAFPNVRVGTSWWFNDTLEGTREHLKAVMEYGVLGVHLGMLTDSRSFTSYVRHDFFRRIVVNMVAELVEKGEYDFETAASLLQDICYNNIKAYLNL
ncbi:MAG: glucuronate isomerase [Bacillota bacterium]